MLEGYKQGIANGYAGGINLYRYVESAPVGMVDAWGRGNVVVPEIGPANLGFLPGHVEFDIKVAVAASSNDLRTVVDWRPSEMLVPPMASSCHRDRVAFAHYVEDIRVQIGGGIVGRHRYVLDTQIPYPFQRQWTTGKSEAIMRDNPGPRKGILWFGRFTHAGLRSLYMNFIDYAICEEGKEKEFSYGDVRWGFFLDWQKTLGAFSPARHCFRAMRGRLPSSECLSKAQSERTCLWQSQTRLQSRFERKCYGR